MRNSDDNFNQQYKVNNQLKSGTVNWPAHENIIVLRGREFDPGSVPYFHGD